MVNNGNRNGREGNDCKRRARGEAASNRAGSRRRFLRAAGAGTAVGLAGCITTEEATETPTPGTSPAGGTGTATGTPELSVDGPITVGAMGPADAPFGASILNAAELAATEITENGGIGGADVEVIRKDTKDDPSVARSAYQELTTGEDVDFTVGIFGSEQLLAILPNIADRETIHLSTGAATPEASRRVNGDYDRFKYYFRAGPVNSHFLGVSLIEFGSQMFGSMGWSSVGMLIEDYKWTEPIRAVIEEQLGDIGVDVPVQTVVPEGTNDFTPVYDEFESAGVDGAYTVLAHIGSTSLVQWAKQQRPFGYGGIHVPTQLPSYFAATKGAAGYTFSQNTATPQSEVTEKTKPFAAAYNESFGKYPVYDGYITYDAVYLLKYAIERSRSMDVDDHVAALEGVNRGGGSFTGAAGIPSFYGRDHRYAHDLRYGPNTRGLYFQWQTDEEGSGSQQVIWPDGLATTEYQSPPWA